jgi:hypothetical protein
VLRPLELAAAGAATVLAFALLLPLAARREREAGEQPPDLVSLSFLRLTLEQQPDNRALRLKLARALLAAGRFDEARAVNARLAASPDPRALELEVEIRFRQWMAAAPDDCDARDDLLASLRSGAERWLGADPDARARERLSEIYPATGQLQLRAQLWVDFARQKLDAAHVERADEAALAVNDPLTSARLWSELAGQLQGPEGARAARRALQRARSADRPREALDLLKTLQPRLGADAELLELGVAISAGQDDELALSLAQRLLALRPDDGTLQHEVAALRAWLHPPAQPAPAPRDELASARSNWDLERVLALGSPHPEARPELIERVSLLEATGRVPEALATLEQARASGFSDDPEVWGRQLALELAAGRVEAGLSTLEGMEGRFGVDREGTYRRSELLLSLGRAREALQLLLRLPLDSDAAHARNVRRLAWELGDLGVVRQALQALTGTTRAEPADFEQLWLIDYEARDFSSALATAQRGYARFASEGLLSLSIDAAQANGDRQSVRSLLARAELEHSARLADPGFWTQRAQLEQERESAALQRADRAAARESYGEIERLLAQARAAAPGGAARYGEIERAERRRALSLALDADDLPRVAALYESEQRSLTAAERVHVLARLGRSDEALQTAVEQLTETPDEQAPERDALQAQAENLALELPRQLWLEGSAQQIPGLFSFTLGGGAEYAFSRELKLEALAELTSFDFSGAGLPGDAPESEPFGDSDDAGQYELAARLRGTYGGSALALGMAARPDGTLRPFGSFEQQLIERLQAHLALIARVNERSLETARLRLLGAQDQLGVRANLGLGEHFYLSADAAGQIYWDLDRDYQGSGASLSGGAGYNLGLGPDWGSANLRVAGYLAPRFAVDPAAGFIADGTSWVGVGASWSRGRLDAPPPSGRSLALLTDATLGWLVPQHELGWSGRLGLGVSLLGADLLSLSIEASNVLGTTPGFAAYGIAAGYRMSEWN